MMATKTFLVLAYVYVSLSCTYAAIVYGYEDQSKNLVKNWDFDSDPSSTGWTPSKVVATKVSGGQGGGSCFRIEQRSVNEDIGLNVCLAST